MHFQKYNTGAAPVKEKTERQIIAENVRSLRAAKDWDRGQLAQRAGVHLCVVRRIESPWLYTVGVDYLSLQAVAAALGTNPVALRNGRVSLAGNSAGAANLARSIEARPSRGCIARVCRALRALAGRG